MNAFRIVVVLLFLAGLGAPHANAAFGVRLGMLTCDIEGGSGFILGSQKRLICIYRPAGSAPRQVYDGSITRIGIDIGATGGAGLAWLVLAATTQLTPGFLEGRYFGVGAEATAGLGVGANALIGGWDRSIVLQPISLQGQVGVNVAGGITGLRLISPPPIAPGGVYKR